MLIEGQDVQQRSVREESSTILVNETGALIALVAELGVEDRALITNQATGATAEFRVAWRSSEALYGRWSYGIAFLNPPEDFWGVEKKESP